MVPSSGPADYHRRRDHETKHPHLAAPRRRFQAPRRQRARGITGHRHGPCGHPSGRVLLFDTRIGMGEAKIESAYRPLVRRLSDLMRAHGIEPDDVDGAGEFPPPFRSSRPERGIPGGARSMSRRASAMPGKPPSARSRPRLIVRPRRSVVASPVRAGSRTCGDVWFRQGLATGEREPRTPLGLVNHVAKRSTWQPPVDSRSRCLGSRVSVEAASASRVVEASCSEAAIRTSVT